MSLQSRRLTGWGGKNSWQEYFYKYCTIHTLSSGTLTVTGNNSVKFQYRKLGDTSWTYLTNNISTLDLDNDETIEFRGGGNASLSSTVFKYTGNFEVYGNIASLSNTDYFASQTRPHINQELARIFDHYYDSHSGLISVKNLVLPFTNFSNYKNVYQSMFSGCVNLIDYPIILAENLGQGTFRETFKKCSSLTKHPKIPWKTLGNSCFYQTFYQSGITKSWSINQSDIPEQAFYQTYRESMISKAGDIIAVGTGSLAFQGMFQGCTYLINPPNLQLANLGSYACRSMFAECTGLISIPNLDGVNFYGGVGDTMFSGCTGLTSVDFTPYYDGSYSNNFSSMFSGCGNLSYIRCKIDNNNQSFSYWLRNVAALGTFVKKTGSTWPSGANGIPSGWTVVEED